MEFIEADHVALVASKKIVAAFLVVCTINVITGLTIIPYAFILSFKGLFRLFKMFEDSW